MKNYLRRIIQEELQRLQESQIIVMPVSKIAFSDVKGLQFPNPKQTSLTTITSPETLEMVRKAWQDAFGDVEVKVDRDADLWFNRIQIRDVAAARAKSSQERGEQGFYKGLGSYKGD
jgi:hypothetical protein